MVEYDNPPVFLFRNNRSCDIKKNRRIVNGKVIFESRFYMNESDALVIISDGVVHAGVGGLLNLGWEWPHINRYLTNVLHKEVIAQNICRQLLEVCKDLYDNKPGDDTTVVTIKIRKEQNISLFTGPPKNKDDDDILINLVKNATGKKIVCGGTTANIISNTLHTPIEIDLKHYTSEVPPMGFMKGIDLVTEGILTLNKVKELLKNYLNSIKKNAIPCAINGSDGASRITNMLINEGTSIDIYIGQAVNPAHQNPSFPDEFNLKIKIVKDIARLLTALGKKVNVNYL